MSRKKVKTISSRTISVILTLLMMLALFTGIPLGVPAAQAALTTEKPVVVVTGKAVIGNGGVYNAANVSYENAYTLDELKALAGSSYAYNFSAINSTGTKNLYKTEGVPVAKLLEGTAFDAASDKLYAVSGDGYSVSFDPNAAYVEASANTTGFGEKRYYYPNILSGGASGAVEVPTILAWASSNSTSALPATAAQSGDVSLRAGQLGIDDKNNPLYNRGVGTVRAGDPIDKALTVNGKSYTRAEVMMSERATRTYSYTTKAGAMSDTVMGIPMSVLLKDVSPTDIVTFETADNYAARATGKTVAELIEGNYILAYKIKNADTGEWEGIFRADKNDASITGVFALYGDTGLSPDSMITSVKTGSSGKNDYKHIDKGIPYDLDALTSATLTVEGPGVSSTNTISVRNLEMSSDDYIFTKEYTNGNNEKFTYQGVDALAVIDGKINTNVLKDDSNVVIVFKNRWRQDIAKIAYADLVGANSAGKPVLIAYGVSNGTDTAPFVFDSGTGILASLKNADGPTRLVYDKSVFKNANTSANITGAFSSVAYIYVEKGAGAPGYKHSESANPDYDNPTNTEYFVTFTGSVLGREVNYTVAELEAMVQYGAGGAPSSGGLGYRGSYGLSNTTYWYVNEYEGIDLWKLLTQKMGVSASKYSNDKDTLVSFAAWDNYKTSVAFSMYQLAHPELFMFYEKSPLDIGTDRPTREQLATVEYQPTIPASELQDWTKDSNGYPVKKGYPVLLAYGVNGYPYVYDSKTPGYSGGLGNDGGPIKIIYGKADGLNRTNSAALENYAYFFNNGSNQIQRSDEIYVGDETRYSTHSGNDSASGAYKAMASDAALGLTVEIKSTSGDTRSYTYTLAEFEDILYGKNVSKSDRDTQGRQEKAYYADSGSGSSLGSSLYEGVNLWYLLSEEIGMAGVLGTVEFYASGSSTAAATYDLNDIREDNGYNSARGTSGLGAMVAFAKNGYPLVSGTSAAGYVNVDSATGVTVKNSGGPLMFVRGQTGDEKAAGKVATTGTKSALVGNLTKIVVNLEADKYAHSGADTEKKITFNGAITRPDGTDITIGTLETKQKHMVTGTFTVGGKSTEYRGLSLYGLLNDSLIGASARMESVTVKNAAGQSKTLSVEDLLDSGLNAILAYGATSGGNPAPLTVADGGLMRLVFNGGSAADCITNVTEITVTASETAGWYHNYGNYAKYASDTLEITGSNLEKSVKYTVAEIEAFENISVNDVYKLVTDFFYEGIDLYKLLQIIGLKGDSSPVTVYARDNYYITFSATQLKEGVNGKPILIGYAAGTTPTNGLPLVPEETDAGYDPNVGNAFGPLRLIVHDNTGWCNKWITRIVVGDDTGTVDPDPEGEKPEFALVLKGIGDGDINCNVGGKGDILFKKGVTADKTTSGRTGQETASYVYTADNEQKTDYVKGVYLEDLLEVAGVDITKTDDYFVTIETTDGFNHATYQAVPLSDIIDQNYFVAYDVAGSEDMSDAKAINDVDKNGKTALVRIYRDINEGQNWQNRVTNVNGILVQSYSFDHLEANKELPFAGTRTVVDDGAGGYWIGTVGGGLINVSASGEITAFDTDSSPALKNNFVSAIAVDGDGGVWFSQNESYTDLTKNHGLGYLKDGSVTWYSSESGHLPDNYVQALSIDESGVLWIGSFGGLTRFDGTSWKIITKADGLPATSVSALTPDGRGGLWVGCYPDGTGTEDDLFKGGFAHLDASGKVDFTEGLVGIYSELASSSLLADAWVRSISVDLDGGAWVAASGSYPNMPTSVGGRVFHVTKSGGGYDVAEYTGNQILGTRLKNGAEIRALAWDNIGGLWIGTSGNGVFYCESIDNILEAYSTQTVAWNRENLSMDNIYAISISGGDVFIASAGGVAVSRDRASFTDIKDHWGKDDINFLVSRGIVRGLGNRFYGAENTLTRAQFITILARLDEDFEVTGNRSYGFDDVADSAWYAPYVNWAANNEIVRGVGENMFSPETEITRQDMVVMLDNYIEYTGKVPAKVNAPKTFADEWQISGYAKAAVSNLQQYGIVNGQTETEFVPLATAKRAEAAAIAARLIRAAGNV